MNFAAAARWVMATACSLLPALGCCQTALIPELFVVGGTPASGLRAQAFFYGIPADTRNGLVADVTDVTVSGASISAVVHPACGAGCFAPGYSMHVVQFPALVPGQYSVDVTTTTGQQLAHFALDAGGPAPPLPAPQIVTAPEQLIGRRPSTVAVFFPQLAFGWQVYRLTVTGNVISAGIMPGCGFATCPPGGSFYGPAVIPLPALPPGVYTLVVSNDAPFPVTGEVGRFTLNVQDVDSIPGSSGNSLVLLMISLPLVASISLRQRQPNPRGNFHG